MDKMSLIVFAKTGHVLGAFTRAVESGGESAPDEVAGDGLLVRDAGTGADLLRVQPQLLKVTSVDRRDDVILRCRDYVVEDGIAAEKVAISGATPLAYNPSTRTLTLTVQDSAAKDLEAWVQLEDGVSQPIVLPVAIASGDSDGEAVVTLSTGSYHALAMVPGYSVRLSTLVVP